MISVRPEIKPKQTLAMTPQLVQAIRLLQFSSTELDQYLANEALENPLLALAEREIGSRVEKNEADSDIETAETINERSNAAADGLTDLPAGKEAGPVRDPSASAPVHDRDGQAPLDMFVDEVSLTARLELSFDAVFDDPADRSIALLLLASVNEAGYLTRTLAEIAEQLSIAEERASAVLHTCQDLAPAGMFARDLGECLRLQLRELDRLDPAMNTLIDHLDDLAAGRFSAVRLRCGVSEIDFRAMMDELRALNPKPGFDETVTSLEAVVPDVFVRASDDGSWRVELNDATLPRLIVDRDYAASISSSLNRSEDRLYVSNCLQRASWLEKCLDQRAQTILKVAGEIVRQQDDFLHQGVASLKPLTLSEVAETIGVHGSTVSRATANKYVATPRGLFPLKYFFASSLVSGENGEDGLSSEAVKHRVRQLTDNEAPGAVLSDDAIAALLAKEGIVIARRTVAKYRDAMGIGSSAQRRREKRTLLAS